MARLYEQMKPEHIAFIEQQKQFFVGTAANDGTVNVRPRAGIVCAYFPQTASPG